MADLIIKPATGDGNKLILQDKAGGAVLTTADSGATIANATLTTPTINSIKLTPTASAPSGVEGAIYFDSNKNALMQYDGTEWLTVSRYSETGLADATGGVISEYTIDADHYRIHAFYTSGIFTLKGTKSCDILLVGGGGGGGGRIGGGGGGGAVFHRSGYSLSLGTYNITVGAGGYGGTRNSTPGSMGGSTIAFGVTAYGGGPGKTRFATNTTDANRANGGGGSLGSAAPTTGTALSASGWTYLGGYSGGTGQQGTDHPGGGGGSATQVGESPAVGADGGYGGQGTNAISWITPMTLNRNATAGTTMHAAFYFAGGGGGSAYGSGDPGGQGGIGGGGGGGSTYGGGGTKGAKDLWEGQDGGSTTASGSQTHGGHGGRNSGGGGGAGAHSGSGEEGGQGGSGVVFIRYQVSL